MLLEMTETKKGVFEYIRTKPHDVKYNPFKDATDETRSPVLTKIDSFINLFSGVGGFVLKVALFCALGLPGSVFVVLLWIFFGEDFDDDTEKGSKKNYDL